MKRFLFIITILACLFLFGCKKTEEEKELFTVTFDSNGGSEVESQEVEKGSSIVKPNDPVKEGYSFDGWYADDEKWSFNGYIVSKDITLKASWKINKYTLKIINYYPDRDLELEFEYNETIDLPAQEYDSSKYEFVNFDSEIPSTMPAYDETITGYWREINIVRISSLYIKSENNLSKVQTGHSLQLYYVVNPTDASITSIKWSVNNAFATIDENGVLTAGNYQGIVKVTIEVSDSVDTRTATKSFQITSEEVVFYPDLGGYTIKIAQAKSKLGEINPFLPIETRAKYGYYDGADRVTRQEAWMSVEEDFNCHIEVIEYPSDAAWGPSRWTYIETQAKIESPDYDFYIIPNSQIPSLSNKNAIVDVSTWYNKYGNDYMSIFAKLAGSYQNKLYAVDNQEKSIYNILGYNVNLWKVINQKDPTIKEPAQMFLDEEWNYSNFVTYCKKCQDALNSIYGADAGYYVCSGWPTYYFVGMVDRNGEGVADVAKMQVHITNEDCIAAANALKEIYDYGAFDGKFSVDQGVVSWNNGKSLFNTGDLWFIGSNSGRWDTNMWGDGDATKYGYVPFPAPNGLENNNNIYIGTTTKECWVMASFRDKYYKGYGEDCATENIYRAICTYWQRIDKYYKESDEYDPNAQYLIDASKFSSQASIDAFMLVSSKLETYAFYDPMTSNSNTVCYTSGSEFDINLRKYVLGTGAATWIEAVGSLQDQLNAAIANTFQ